MSNRFLSVAAVDARRLRREADPDFYENADELVEGLEIYQPPSYRSDLGTKCGLSELYRDNSEDASPASTYSSARKQSSPSRPLSKTKQALASIATGTEIRVTIEMVQADDELDGEECE